MKIKHKLQECIPTAYYSDGTEAKCWLYKICNMFDVNNQSFKQVKIRNDIGKKKTKSVYDLMAKWADSKK